MIEIYRDIDEYIDTVLFLTGMNEVCLHDFIGKCSMDDLSTVFPTCAMWYIKAEQVKDAIIFEESTGHEETIGYLYTYHLDLEKYKQGI